MSTSSKCVAPHEGEEIVHTHEMVNRGICDKGYIQLAIRSGQFQTINVTEIKEGELTDFNLLTGAMQFKAVPNRAELPTIGYAAYFKLTNGFEKTLYTTVAEVEAHAKKYSQTYSSKKDYIQKSSKWATDFDAMAKKTVIKQLLSKYAPLSVEMQEAVRSDQSVIDDKGQAHYVDNQSVEEAVAEEITENANKQSIGFDPETGEVLTPEAEEPAPAAQPEPINAPDF